ncbi:hypothetical protein [Staphylococcus shinii]|uniref:hypothetical protein n=1 Tax=Staphylococcus shinii TaxID=2912228 RepID=UPI003F836A22
MYYKIFKKGTDTLVEPFNELTDSYIDFIKTFTSKGYNQFIITTDIMIDLMVNTINKNGLVKDIYFDEDLYDYRTSDFLKSLPTKINENKSEDVKNILDNSFINSIEIVGIKVKFNKQYFTMRSNGIISSDSENKLVEENIQNLFDNL